MNAPKRIAAADPSAALAAPDRLDALQRSGLMDSATEEVFDRAARLAGRVLGVPVGLLSLVDQERQFFKAQAGLSGWAAAQRGTPLSHSFCQHVVASDAPLVVRDSRAETLVLENRAIEDLRVIAYLGVPVRAPGGHVLGALCAISSEPQDWTDDDVENLRDIASGVESEIALRFHLAASREAQGRLEGVLEAMPIGVALADARDGRLVYMNRIGQEKVGTGVKANDADAYAALGARNSDGTPYEAEDYPLVRAALHGKTVSAEPMNYRLEDGRMRELEVDATRIEGHGLAVATFRDVTARNAARRERERMAHRVSGILEATTDAVFVLDGDWRVLYANEGARAFGYDIDNLVGRRVQDALPDIEETSFWSRYVAARDTGEPQVYEDVDRYTGRLVEVRVFPRGEELILVGRDVADERRAEAQRKVIVRELNHRVKNLFAVISGMIGMTARTAESPVQMARTLRGRVAALARAHELVRPAITSEDAGLAEGDLSRIVATVIEPHTGDTAPLVSGPPVRVGPQAATSLALALHELATNAAKYGALAERGGALGVTWEERGDMLHLVWDETVTGDPVVPGEPGFGTTLIEMSVRIQLGGEVATEWRPDGVRVAFDLPLARLPN